MIRADAKGRGIREDEDGDERKDERELKGNDPDLLL